MSTSTRRSTAPSPADQMSIDYPLLCDRDKAFVKRIQFTWERDDYVETGGSYYIYSGRARKWVEGRLTEAELRDLKAYRQRVLRGSCFPEGTSESFLFSGHYLPPAWNESRTFIVTSTTV